MVFSLALLAFLAQNDFPGTRPSLDDLEGEESPGTPPVLQMSLLAWEASPSGWLEITQGSRPGSATHMGIGSDIALDPQVAPAIDGRVRLLDSHALGIQFSRFASSGTRIASDSFIYHGDLFEAGREVQADVDFTFVSADYQYTFNAGDPLQVTGHLGGELWIFSSRVETVDGLSPLDTRRAFSSGFWLGGLDLSVRPLPFLELRASGDGGFERVHQDFFKVAGEVLWRPWEHLALSAGYRYLTIRFLQSTNRSNIAFQGPTLGLELSF